jgi:hypothetical protein
MRFLDKLWHNLKFNYSYNYRRQCVEQYYNDLMMARTIMNLMASLDGHLNRNKKGIYTLQELLEE